MMSIQRRLGEGAFNLTYCLIHSLLISNSTWYGIMMRL
jgi:hypothetical protein